MGKYLQVGEFVLQISYPVVNFGIGKNNKYNKIYKHNLGKCALFWPQNVFPKTMPKSTTGLSTGLSLTVNERSPILNTLIER
jgi:hypothetical protein